MSTASILALEAQLRVLARRVRRNISERASALDPSLGEVGFAVADHLYRNGEVRQRDLVADIATEKAAVSRAVSQMVELGLATREPDPQDGRGHLVALSDTGKRRMDGLLGARRAEFRAKLAGWDDGELQAFVAMLERYNAALEG